MAGFRPRLVPTLVTVPIVVLCLGLGFWQIHRLHWKLGLIAAREAALSAAPAPPPQTLAEARRLALHPIAVSGVFLNDKENYLHAIGPSGDDGYQVLTPLRVAPDRFIFIDRGFVPRALKDPRNRRAGQLASTVHLVGLLRLPPSRRPSWFLPHNQPAQNHWFWVDLPALAAADHLDHVAPFYLDADKTPNPGGWPQGGVALPELPNHHLQYAITWFALAVAMVAVYVVYHRQNQAR